MLTAFIQVNIVWALGFMLYSLFSRNDTFFQLRRIVLLGLALLSLLFPWMGALVPSGYVAELQQTDAVALPELMVTVSAAVSDSWTSVLLWAYVAVGAVLLGRWLIRFFSVMRLIRRSPQKSFGGLRYYSLPSGVSPFSFFGFLCLPADTVRSPFFSAIVRHERTHIRQLHSFDVALLNVACAILWCNPAVWLTMRELTRLHEFLADRQAVNDTPSARSYQLALLGFCVNRMGVPLVNNFKTLPLRERIQAMNSGATRRLWSCKYLLALPFVFAAMSLSALSADELRADATALGVHDGHFDEGPVFKNGQHGLGEFLYSNIHYPADAQENSIMGLVVVEFVICADGTVRDAKVVNSVHPSVDAEALRVINMLKYDRPAMRGGKPVESKFTLSVQFRLA